MESVPRDIDRLERILEDRGIPFVRERFRVPARPGISPAAGLAGSGLGAFLLAAGRPGAAFLAGVLGTAILFLDAFGFSPLDWAGPKRRTTALVVPGDPPEDTGGALFLSFPLACGAAAGSAVPGRSGRDLPGRVGLALSLFPIALAAAAALLLFPPAPVPCAGLGALLLALGAAEWRRRGEPPGPPNVAVLGGILIAAGAAGGRRRPFVLFHPGDGAEVKFFLARYRGPLFRGRGVFAEFPEGAAGSAEVGVREGPSLPYRVDPGLLAVVQAAAASAGVPSPALRVLRRKTPGLAAMARGFRSVTLMRRPVAPPGRSPLPDGAALAWLDAVAERLAREGGSGL